MGHSNLTLTEPRAHAIARAHNLEWVFSKETVAGAGPLSQQIISLGQAVKRLPTSWTEENQEMVEARVRDLFSIPRRAAWFARAWEDIQDCHPPMHELSKWSHGLAILRWMLHRILPYPCFLMDSYHLASRFRVTHKSLLEAMRGSDRDVKFLEPAQYRGILDEFLGRRWWRSGVEAILWQATEGNSFDRDAILSVLSRVLGSSLVPSNIDQPVVCIDRDYQPLEEAFPADSAVRIQPDDWPPYADQAWTTLDLARQEPSLRALVLNQDRSRIL